MEARRKPGLAGSGTLFPSGNSLQQISAMQHCHFALFALSNSSHPHYCPLQSVISPPSSFRVHYLSPEGTVKVTAQLLSLNGRTRRLARLARLSTRTAIHPRSVASTRIYADSGRYDLVRLWAARDTEIQQTYTRYGLEQEPQVFTGPLPLSLDRMS
jgi:hypothetical protein